jgi:hypothetical protein
MIGRARLGTEFTEQRVVARAALQFGNPRIGIVDIAEGNRLGRTNLLACGLEIAVANIAIFFLCVDARMIDALHAVRAFLHHAAAAHRHVGIPLHSERFGFPIRIQEEIEATHLVRTVVRTIPRADAAVVDHVVQAFVVVDGRIDRTHDLARRSFTMHAGNRLVNDVRIVEIAFEVAIDANPLHLAAFDDFFFADDGDVVLRLASDRTGVAADACVQVDRHPPGVPFVRVVWEQGLFVRVLDVVVGLLKIRMLAVGLERRLSNRMPALHAGVVLRGRQHVRLRRLAHRQPAAVPKRVGPAQLIRIESDTVRDAPRRPTAVS